MWSAACARTTISLPSTGCCPKIDKGDLLVIHDTGAHGFAMGYNYNGKLRSAEVLLKPDGSFQNDPPGRDPGRLLCHLRLYAVLQKIIAKQKQMHPLRYICFLHILFYFCSKVIPLWQRRSRRHPPC